MRVDQHVVDLLHVDDERFPRHLMIFCSEVVSQVNGDVIVD